MLSPLSSPRLTQVATAFLTTRRPVADKSIPSRMDLPTPDSVPDRCDELRAP